MKGPTSENGSLKKKLWGHSFIPEFPKETERTQTPLELNTHQRTNMSQGETVTLNEVDQMDHKVNLQSLVAQVAHVRFLFIRHGNAQQQQQPATEPPQQQPFCPWPRKRKPHGWDEDDIHRQLTPDGMKQCREAREWYSHIQPTDYLVSPSVRCAATAEHLVALGAPTAESGCTLPLLHPSGFLVDANPTERRAMECCLEAFECIGTEGSLADYFTDEHTEQCFMVYAERALRAVLCHAVQRSLPEDATLAVFGHAIFLNAVALLLARTVAAAGADELHTLEDLYLGEAEGITVRASGTLLVEHVKAPGTIERATAFVKTNFLLVALSCALIVGLALPAPGTAASEVEVAGWPFVSTALVVIMFIINGVCLNSDEAKQAIGAWKVLLYSIPMILCVTPAIAWTILRVPGMIGMEQSLLTGFVIFNAMPTTLSSGVTLVRQAKGNAALALVMTVCTNVLGVFVAPFSLSLLLSTSGVQLEPSALLLKLCVTIITPLLLGKGARELIPGMPDIVKQHKQALGLSQQSCVVLIAFMKLSASSAQILETSGSHLLMVLLTSAVIHATYLALNWASAALLRLPEAERKPLILLCSQKTFPVAMAVISFIDPAAVSSLGLVVIPCLVSHFVQLFCDAVIATRWANQYADEDTPPANPPAATPRAT